MIDDLVSIITSLEFSKAGRIHETSGQKIPRPFYVAGRKCLKYIFTVGLSDVVLPLGDLANIGLVCFENLGAYLCATPGTPIISNVGIPTPNAPLISNIGAAGAATVVYRIQAVMPGGDVSTVSATATTTTSNATLDSTNFNRLVWEPIIMPDGQIPDFYAIYRTTSPTTPSTNGKIGTFSGLTFDDTGLPGDGTTAPTPPANATTWTYKIVSKGVDGSYSVASAAGSTATGRTKLTQANYNKIKWLPVPGAVAYDIYRTVAGTYPSSTGRIITNMPAGSFLIDTDGISYEWTIDNPDFLTADSVAPPSTTPWDFRTQLGSNGTLYDVALNGGDCHVLRWNSAAIHAKSVVNPTDIIVTLIER